MKGMLVIRDPEGVEWELTAAILWGVDPTNESTFLQQCIVRRNEAGDIIDSKWHRIPMASDQKVALPESKSETKE